MALKFIVKNFLIMFYYTGTIKKLDLPFCLHKNSFEMHSPSLKAHKLSFAHLSLSFSDFQLTSEDYKFTFLFTQQYFGNAFMILEGTYFFIIACISLLKFY
jgi:hypothetical protein